jgi:hypothetical protein
LGHRCLLPVQRPNGLPAVESKFYAPSSVPCIERVCENCAREDDDLVAVHRVYLTPESWDAPASSQTVPDVEVWCFSCRSQYPHETHDNSG